ncbi:MAG: hypothetical protein HY788_06825 [Deltaproteobacteria bacterium]|nr:hypothetical protein [Deltaproteobacteria bacterium]
MNVYECTALTGGGANALDAITWFEGGAADGDMAFATVSQRFYVFRYDGTASAAETVAAHPYVIKPDDAGANNGRWKEATAAIIESDFNHDSLTGFVANEHIDWTNATSNFVTTGSVTLNNSAATYPLDLACSRAGAQYIRIVHSANQSVGNMLQRNQSGGSYNVQWLYYIPNNQTRLQWFTDGAAGIAMYLTADAGNLYILGDCSAATFTDRTPAFAGDAVAAIRSISAKPDTVDGRGWGELDHGTLPAGVLVETVEDKKTVRRRNLSNMVSLLTKGFQELAQRVEALEGR